MLISLASFDLSAESVSWYNILNLNLISCDHDYMPSSYLNCLRHSELSSVPLNLKHPSVGVCFKIHCIFMLSY